MNSFPDIVGVASCSGLSSGEFLAEILMRQVGLGLFWGSFRLGKGLISRMLVGGFKVDFGSVWAPKHHNYHKTHAIAGVTLNCHQMKANTQPYHQVTRDAGDAAAQPTNRPTNKPAT